MEYNFKNLSAVLGCFDKSYNIKGGLLNDECSLTIKEGKKPGSFELWDEYDEYADSPVFSEYYKNIAHVKGTANWTRIEFKNGGEVTITVPPVKRVLMLDTSKYRGKQTEKKESVMVKHFIFNEDIKIPGTNLILEKGDKVYVKEAMKAGLNCSNVQSIRTPRLKYDMHVKYGKMQPHEAPEELDKIVRNAGFYHDRVGDPSYVKFMRAKGYDQWVLYYLGQGRDFRLIGINGDDFIITLR